jgi:DNA-binding winged helix-turn-helix (wHTH) protein
MPAIHRFGPFELRVASRTLLRDGEPLAVGPRQVAILALLLSTPGAIVSKDQVMSVGWNGEITSENSVDKIMFELRRLLGDTPGGGPYVETVRRRGYRFTAPVTRDDLDGLEALLRPHRRWIEGRAALETLHLDQVARARVAFEEAVRSAPQHAPAHVGLANAAVMQFEATRADAEPDGAALARAVQHAHVACQLDPDYAEAWATLGFALARAGHLGADVLARLGAGGTTPADALAAARRATMIEKENWRHQLRLASVGWGEERLGAVRRTLSKVPGLPLAHFLAATVYVARQTFEAAEREVLAGIAGHEAQRAAHASFGGVALHWLHGLLRLMAGDRAGAEAAFMRELSLECEGHIYARECAAHTWHALGAVRLGSGDAAGALEAFEAALARVPAHPLAHAGRVIARRQLGPGVAARDEDKGGPAGVLPTGARGAGIDLALARAALLVEAGSATSAAALVTEACAATTVGSAGWILPIEPLVGVQRAPEEWRVALATLRGRAM